MTEKAHPSNNRTAESFKGCSERPLYAPMSATQIDRTTVRRLGTALAFVVIGIAVFVQPALSERGFGAVGIAVQVALALVVLWSLALDVQALRVDE